MKSYDRKTRITLVERDRILLRGYDITELTGRISWGAVVFLTLTGNLPSEPVGKMIDAILVSVVDHGPTPVSTLAACTATSAGATLSGSVAAGILAIAEHHGAAIEACMNVLEESVSLDDLPIHAAEKIVRRYRERGTRPPGFGHREHSTDPRTDRLFEIARELRLSGVHVKHALAIAEVLRQSSSKPVPINADGAIAALLCEINFPKPAANGLFMIARLPGLIAHILEERELNPPLRPINPQGYAYDGPFNENFRARSRSIW